MARRLLFATFAVMIALVMNVPADYSLAGQPPPNAPATVSWLPHGYGGKMWVQNTPRHNQKGYLGFRTAPEHVGCWSQPLWGWDVNGYFKGPNVAKRDPGKYQLPIGLIYPENTPMVPGPGPMGKIRKVHR